MSRLNCSDHRWYPSATLINCAVMRSLSPDRCTLPSSTADTFSNSPILRMSSFFPLNAHADVRAGTRNPGTFASPLSTSSVMPSLKYSFSLSPLMFTNGSTATDFCPAGSVLAGLTGAEFEAAAEVTFPLGDGDLECHAYSKTATRL